MKPIVNRKFAVITYSNFQARFTRSLEPTLSRTIKRGTIIMRDHITRNLRRYIHLLINNLQRDALSLLPPVIEFHRSLPENWSHTVILDI